MQLLHFLYRIVWGIPGLCAILGIGFYLSFRLRLPQIRFFIPAFRMLRQFHKPADGISPVQALSTALAGTVGTGNLIGVAGAICFGGPGALFWMLVSGFFGMAVKFSEAALSAHFRFDAHTKVRSGPMYFISRGMDRAWHPLAALYAFLGIGACFGIGNLVQVHAIISGYENLTCGVNCESDRAVFLIVSFLIFAAAAAVMLGGWKRVFKTAEKLIPLLSLSYFLLCFFLLAFHYQRIIPALHSIVKGAFTPRAATGGMIGSAVSSVQYGCSRGIFSNEAGLGTSSIAHGTAASKDPVEQGMMGIIEVFVDTFLVCTMTGLVILVSNAAIPYNHDAGLSLTNEAFGKASTFVSIFLMLFAFATILSWSYYGSEFAFFLWGKRGETLFRYIFLMVIPFGSAVSSESIWCYSEILNGLMMIPNLIALAVLSPELAKMCKEYKLPTSIHYGGNYADFHQCKSL